MNTSLAKMEEKRSNSGSLKDVNVYIILDSSDFEMMKAKQAKRKQSAGSKFTDAFSDAPEDLNLSINYQFVKSTRGALLLGEMILSIVLIIISAIDSTLVEGQAVGVIMNSITLAAGIFHLVVIVTGVIEYLPSHAIIISVQLLKNVTLLLLQFAAFIVYVSCGYGIHAGSIMFTLSLCFMMVLSIFFTSKEYNPRDGKKPKKYKKKKCKGRPTNVCDATKPLKIYKFSTRPIRMSWTLISSGKSFSKLTQFTEKETVSGIIESSGYQECFTCDKSSSSACYA